MLTSYLSEYQAILIQNYVHVFPITILFYDHLLTFDDEYRHIWKLKKSFSSYCFLLNRYTALLGNISVLVAEFLVPFPINACKSFQLYRQALLFWNQLLCVILLTMRIYALYQRSKRLLLRLSIWATVLLAIAFWAVSGQNSQPGHPDLGCHMAFPNDVSTLHVVLPWEAVLLYDITLVVLTVYKSFTTYRSHMSMSARGQRSLISLLFRDGVTYFVTISLVNLGNAVTYYAIKEPFLKGCLSTFSSCVSVVLVSRLVLNLHKNHGRSGVLTTTSTSNTAGPLNQPSVELDTLAYPPSLFLMSSHTIT